MRGVMTVRLSRVATDFTSRREDRPHQPLEPDRVSERLVAAGHHGGEVGAGAGAAGRPVECAGRRDDDLLHVADGCAPGAEERLIAARDGRNVGMDDAVLRVERRDDVARRGDDGSSHWWEQGRARARRRRRWHRSSRRRRRRSRSYGRTARTISACGRSRKDGTLSKLTAPRRPPFTSTSQRRARRASRR